MRVCAYCNGEMPQDASCCPSCGRVQPTRETYNDYLPWSIVAVILCAYLPTSIVALVFSILARQSYAQGNETDARAKARTAKLFLWITLGIGAAMLVLGVLWTMFVMVMVGGGLGAALRHLGCLLLW
nr:CD225/dispanin family protein [Maliibacterium massiliense]